MVHALCLSLHFSTLLCKDTPERCAAIKIPSLCSAAKSYGPVTEYKALTTTPVIPEVQARPSGRLEFRQWRTSSSCARLNLCQESPPILCEHARPQDHIENLASKKDQRKTGHEEGIQVQWTLMLISVF